jgi:hypothetical protein
VNGLRRTLNGIAGRRHGPLHHYKILNSHDFRRQSSD